MHTLRQVYKGILSSGEEVAIKRARSDSLQGAPEFKKEIEVLSRVHHRNLVGLVGFCFENGEQMLVYEFMPNGTLRDYLSGTWHYKNIVKHKHYIRGMTHRMNKKSLLIVQT